MEVIWTKTAELEYLKILDYWDEHNGSPFYSDKIENNTNQFLEKISSPNCIFYGRYSTKLNLFIGNILDGKFQIFFKVIKEKNTIEVRNFKSSKQNY